MTAKNFDRGITPETEAISLRTRVRAAGDYAHMSNLIWSRGIRFGVALSREEIVCRYGVSE